MKRLTQEEIALLMRHDFGSFQIGAFQVLNPDVRYRHNWHLDLLASRLTDFAQGKITRLVIMLPPRSLKSHCASICLPAWILGQDPGRRIVCASYSGELAEALARSCLTLLRSPLYRLAFPHTQLSALRSSVSEFMTTKQGFRLATSVGGTLTGKGGDFLIVDDACKPEEALSDILRMSVNEWYASTAYPRLNDKAKGGVLIIMQRLHEDDLAGYVLQQEGWEVVRLPAIAESDEVHEWESLLGPQRKLRLAGEALHPSRESLDVLAQIRATQGEYHFAGQYQQRPVPLGGGMVQQAWFHYYEPDQLPQDKDLVWQSWDTASKESELADYSVCTTWHLCKHHIYLVDVRRERMEYPKLKRAVREQYERYRPDTILIENKSSGTQLVQEMLHDGVSCVKGVEPEGNKVMRMNAQTGIIENGFVHLPTHAPWLADYLMEMTTFPRSKYQDQVDSTSQALKWYIDRMPYSGLIDWMRQEVEAQKRGKA